MSTDTLERQDTDFELLEFTDEDEATPCFGSGCEKQAEWLSIWSCGHAFHFCQEHHDFINNALARKARVACQEGEVHLIRWEKL